MPGVDLLPAVVGEEVRAAQIRDRAAAIDVSAGDGAAAQHVVVDIGWKHGAPRLGAGSAGRGVAAREGRVPFEAPPAVVHPSRFRRRVHFLERRLAHVRDDEVTCLDVEARAPGVAEPERPDLVASGRGAKERVGRWARVGRTAHVQPQHLAQEAVDGLRAVLGIAAAPPISLGHVEVAVRPEPHPAPIVVVVGLRDRQDDLARGVGYVRIPGDGESNDPRRPGRVGVIHVEPAAGRIVRRERQTQESLLVPRGERGGGQER